MATSYSPDSAAIENLMSSDPKKTLLFWVILYIFCPVLNISGHFINLVEFYTFILFALNIKNLKDNGVAKIFALYGLALFLVILFTAFMARTGINNYDIFQIRSVVQLVLTIYLFDSKVQTIIANEGHEEFRKFFLKLLALLTIPALIVILQKLDILSARAITFKLYSPQFFFLGAEQFSEYRYTSIFKDFFTAGVYFTTLASAQIYALIQGKLSSKERLVTLFLLSLTYSSLFFVARTGLIMVPLIGFSLILFSGDSKVSVRLKNLLLSLLALLPISLFIYILSAANLINFSWVLEGVGTDSNNSSFELMQKWNQLFFEMIKEKPDFLFRPAHAYTLTVTTDPLLYSDSFYVQEAYRYGVYGIFIYIVLIFLLLKKFLMKNAFLATLVLAFVVLNYKGGNVFLMQKNIYLYALFFAAMPYIKKQM